LQGLERIALILHAKKKEPMARRNGVYICLRMMYDITHSRINTFLGDERVNSGFFTHAFNLNKATEQLVASIKHVYSQRSAKFSMDLVPENELCAFHANYRAFHTAILHRYNDSNLRMISCLKRNVGLSAAVQQVLNDRRRLNAHSQAIFDSVQKTSNYLARQLNNLLDKQPEKKRHSLDASRVTRDLVFKFRERHEWMLMATDDDILASQGLMERCFVFTAELDSLDTDMQSQLAHSIIATMEKEMEFGLDVSKTLSVFWTYLEEAMRRVAAAMGKQSEIANFRLGEVRLEWNAGRTTWDTVIRTLDAAVADLKLLDWEAGKRWEDERPGVVAKKPNPIQAFVSGLLCVWSVWKTVNVAGINAAFQSSVVNLRNFELNKRLSESFQRRLVLWRIECNNVRGLVKEVVETFPSFKQRLAQRVKGSKYAFHGLMVAHVVFRRNKRLISTECPETMVMWGKQLKNLQDRVRLFCDAAIIISACADEELGAVSRYIKSYTQRELVPVFMPISQGSSDRAEYALKNKRGAFEKEFTKLFALHALCLGSRTLPGNLGMLQDWANCITLDLGKVIRMDRGVHHARYAELINEVCKEFGDGVM
jgi:hypothetical protein